jgi:hypothetical protein
MARRSRDRSGPRRAFPVLGLVEEEFGFASGELIARRTVARDRGQLGILSSSQRKPVLS